MKTLFGFGGPDGVERDNIREVVSILKDAIGHENWFIAGSFAVPKIKKPNDIDIFFPTEEDCTAGIENVERHVKGSMGYISSISADASSYNIPKLPRIVQLVTKHYGKVDRIFDEFDLNVCKRAILPNGKRIVDRSAREELKITRINHQTFQRYFKYLNRLGREEERVPLGKALVDKYIEDTTMIDEYYDGNHIVMPANQALFETLHESDAFGAYVCEQARVRAPELLI